MEDAKRSFSWGQTTQRQKEKGTYWSGLSRKWPPFSGNESLIRKLSRNNLPVNPHFPFLFSYFLCSWAAIHKLIGPELEKKERKEKKGECQSFGSTRDQLSRCCPTNDWESENDTSSTSFHFHSPLHVTPCQVRSERRERIKELMLSLILANKKDSVIQDVRVTAHKFFVISLFYLFSELGQTINLLMAQFQEKRIKRNGP